MYELRITLWLCLLAFVLSSVEVKAQVPPIFKDYRPLTDVVICEDVKLPCVPLIPKDTDILYAVFSPEGKLVAITRIRGDKEEVIWGILKLPLKRGEQDL